MINLNEISIKPVDGVFGFVYRGNVYIELHNSMTLLGLYKLDGDKDATYLYSRMHKEFYSTLHQLRINPDEYPIPIIQEPIKNKNGTISEYKVDLPYFILDSVLFKIAERKRDEQLTYYQIKLIVTKFKNLKNLVRTEFDELLNSHQDEQLIDSFRSIAHQDEQLTENKRMASMMNTQKPKITNCKIFGIDLSGFVWNRMIYLNSRESAHVIGLTRRSSADNTKFTIRWDEYYEYYTSASASLGGENLMGIDVNTNKINRKGPKSKWEELIPEYITLFVVLGVANYLNNMNAMNFKMEFLKHGLPFFLNNASQEEINNVNFLRSIKPLLDERERQLNIERQQQAIQQAQYMEMQYQNYIRSLQYFNSNMNTQGLRPAIPGGTTNFSGMAYAMPNPEDIQKNLDSQPKDRIDVVRFENPNVTN